MMVRKIADKPVTHEDADEARALRAQRIIEAVAAIPKGRVASYGAIAARAGYPGRARLIGRVLGDAPDRLSLPWHRVLRADGHIGIPEGSKSYREQCRRLRAEGVEVVNGRVAMSHFGLDHDLDRAIWGG
ncbi:methylated-DNA-protein-cysteine methyltransferase-like protein [Luteibacter sp. Sphag1AF]|uniref:MGMT family protein n=1 Tax=Luteibacter sp. Sphag1AF TaxID=2587031 RepID=UPI0017D94775|nr:MGMT family protein [Luteibacter sp. Sphag1AF]MBB3225646.1 methylated-DNA-protein-cysteine methyltransferase-like protein [Luteibacter sp. Sphag1AF]